MPARKESAARRKLREKLTLKPEKRKKKKEPKRAPTCSTCPYLSARQVFKRYKRRIKRDGMWQWYCGHRDAGNRSGVLMSTDIGKPQFVKSVDQMQVVHVRRPLWCPLDIEHSQKEKYYYEGLSQ